MNAAIILGLVLLTIVVGTWAVVSDVNKSLRFGTFLATCTVSLIALGRIIVTMLDRT